VAKKRTKDTLTDPTARERLLSVGADLFYRKGYAGTTVRELIRKAAVTPPVLYYYFGSKEGLFRELMQSKLREAEPIYDVTQLREESVKDRILGFAAQFYPLFVKNRDAVRLMLSTFFGPTEQSIPFPDVEENHRKFYHTIRSLVQEGIEKGEFSADNPEDLAWVVFSVINTAMETEITHPGDGMSQEGMLRILRLIFRQVSTDREGT
jgi:TetR/AcrR family transcriptional regulator